LSSSLLQVDARLFAAALRLVLGRLRTVEEATGAALLKCVDWGALRDATEYVPGLWTGPDALLSSEREEGGEHG
jgi:hypothetical protein